MAVKVLILDDEREILEALRRLLELDDRFEVYTEEDPQKALDLLNRENIQIVLCDIVMPEMDGLNFLQVAKSINGLVQVVMMSAYSTVERVITALERGAADYIMKPIDPEELKRVLDDLVKRLSRWRDLVVKARGVQDASEATEKLPPLDKLRELEAEEDTLRREKLLFDLQDYLGWHPDEELVRAMLSSPDPFVRNGVLAVGKRWDAGAIPLLERLFEHEDPNFRKLVLDLASFVPAEEVIVLFRRALSDPDPNVRLTAAEYLRDRGDEQALELMADLLLREEEPMALAVLFEALADTGCGVKSGEILERFRGRLDSVLVRPFLKFVGSCGGPEEMAWLEKGLLSGEIPYCREAVDALISLRERFPQTEVSEDLLSFLKEKALEENHPLGVYQLLRLVSLLDEQEARSFAEALLREEGTARAEGAREFLGLEDDREEEA